MYTYVKENIIKDCLEVYGIDEFLDPEKEK